MIEIIRFTAEWRGVVVDAKSLAKNASQKPDPVEYLYGEFIKAGA